MACDGDIAEEEVALLKSIAANEHVFDGLQRHCREVYLVGLGKVALAGKND